MSINQYIEEMENLQEQTLHRQAPANFLRQK